MIFWTNLQIALEALKASRSRTYLTMLGVIIGIATVTLILAIGEGLKQSVQTKVENLNNNLVVARPGVADDGLINERDFLRLSPLAPYATTTITEQDFRSLVDSDRYQDVAPMMIVSGSVRSDTLTPEKASIVATTSELSRIFQLKTVSGQFIDDSLERDTVVLGNWLAIHFFGTDQPVGEHILLRGRQYTVVGVLSKNDGPTSLYGVDFNQTAFVNIDAGKSFNQGIAQFQQIVVVPKDGTSNNAAIKTVRKTLLNQHSGEEDFVVTTGAQAAELSRDFYQLVTTISSFIAVVSLIVGGIGIMNIMLVGVAERTREIGVRKSLGASNRHIYSQFLIEALIISMSGGVIGVIFAYAGAATIGLLFGFYPAINWTIIGIAFGLSVVVGVVFGLVPAIRAARKDPIDALRQNG